MLEFVGDLWGEAREVPRDVGPELGFDKIGNALKGFGVVVERRDN